MYLWLKFLHVLAVVMFLGNIVTGVFWHRHALRTRDPKLLAHAMDGVRRSDRLFTMPGVFLILGSGIWAAIQWTIVLFAVSGITFGTRIAPIQKQLHAFAEAGTRRGAFDLAAYERLSKRWEFWGWVAIVTPVAGVALMVLKPAL
jgi:uncharacterized membrane protein